MTAKNIFIAFFVIPAFTIAIIMATTSVVPAQSTADGDGIIEPGEDPTEELAKASQNPIANMISLPFQNNTNFNVGPKEKTQNVLNIQPVWPISLNEEWNLITRTIIPVISQPEFFPGQDRENGLGDINFTAFFSPAEPGKWIWGVGPVLLFPTATDDVLGTEKFFGALDGQVFNHINILASPIPTGGGIAFSIFISHHTSLSLQHRFRNNIF